jgi:protein-glutamine gamma-glutamyltransferase
MTAPALIPRNALAWLLTAQVVVLIPQLPRLPIWVSVLWIVCAVWRVQIQRMRWSYPGPLLKTLAMLVAVAGVFGEQGSLLGLDAAVMLLLLLFMLKLLEMRTPRDALVVIYLGFFIVATAFLFDQSILLALYQCFSVLVLVAALVGLQQTPGRNDPARALRTGGVLLLQAVPLMLVLFIFFPRVGPLWAVNAPGGQGSVGLSESMAPGDIADLAMSANLAFRVSFEGQVPRQDELYWRAMTLESFDGRRWSHSGLTAGRAPGVWQAEGDAVSYQVVTRATGQLWAFSLRGATTNDSSLMLTQDFMLQARRPINQTMAYSVTSWPESLLHPEPLDVLQRRINLALPEGYDPRTRAWAQTLRQRYPDDQQLINALLVHFNREPFHYTLRPDRLGKHTNDEFLFDSRRGFCAHYAGAMVVVLREVGIPARVVAGYQGGELNPRGNYVLVHQFDAHAWVEAWLPDRGWVSFDPTFQVAPERIEQGLQQAMAGEGSFLEGSPLAGVRYREIGWVNNLRLAWDDVNYQWQLRVLGYQSERQLETFRRWLGTADWQRIGLIMLILIALIMIPLALWTLRPERRDRDPRKRAWQELNQRMARLGLQAHPGEGPRDWQRRLCEALPEQRSALAEFFDQYVLLTYAQTGDRPNRPMLVELRLSLQRLLKSLPRRVPGPAASND